jgi:uncharacterized protein YggE
MDLVGSAVRMTSRGMLATLLVLLAALVAVAPLASAEDSEPNPAGITVTGIGVTERGGDAADRAMKDARSRAVAIARVLRVGLGPVQRIELPEVTQFERSPFRCGSSRSIPAICREVAMATVTFAIAGGATADGPRSVGASATASVEVESSNELRNRAVKRAILDAREQATQEAATNALASVRQAAKVSGLQLGPIFSVAEVDPSDGLLPEILTGSSFDAALGTWGPGLFCGIIKRPVFGRDPVTGKRKVVRRTQRRRCTAPSDYDVRLEIKYNAL